jgi:hypothetical protein
MALMKYLSEQHSQDHFGSKSTMLPGITRLILDCYTEENALGNLRIIASKNRHFAWQKNISSMGPWTSIRDLNTAYS